MMILVQLAILLTCIFIGARMSGIGLGVMGMLGLLILLFVFGMPPSDPPLEVMLIILSVVTAAAALQAAGGMDFLVEIAGRLLRSSPERITILGPLVTFCFTLFAGTAHISYSILPIIAEVAIKKRIRPERALSMSVTASHMGITASPVSAATAAVLTVLGPNGVQLVDILMVCIPATLIGVAVGILFVLKRGKDLGEDPEFLERMKDPAFVKLLEGEEQSAATVLKPGAVRSVVVFALAVLSVVLLGSFPSLLPEFPDKLGAPGFAVSAAGKVQMPAMIMMIMLAAAGLIILFCKTTAAQVTKASLFASAGQATIAVFGVVWMSSTFMDFNYALIQSTLGEVVTSYPFLFAVALFTLSILLFSQAATTRALMPLGLTLGLTPAYLVGIFPATNGHFFVPGYPTLLTAIQFDRTGTDTHRPVCAEPQLHAPRISDNRGFGGGRSHTAIRSSRQRVLGLSSRLFLATCARTRWAPATGGTLYGNILPLGHGRRAQRADHAGEPVVAPWNRNSLEGGAMRTIRRYRVQLLFVVGVGLAGYPLADHLLAQAGSGQTAPAMLHTDNLDPRLRGFRWRSIGPTGQGGRIDDIAVVETTPASVSTFYLGLRHRRALEDGQQRHHLRADLRYATARTRSATSRSRRRIRACSTSAQASRTTVRARRSATACSSPPTPASTFMNIGLRETQSIARVVVHPKNPDMVWVAAVGHLFGPNRRARRVHDDATAARRGRRRSSWTTTRARPISSSIRRTRTSCSRRRISGAGARAASSAAVRAAASISRATAARRGGSSRAAGCPAA